MSHQSTSSVVTRSALNKQSNGDRPVGEPLFTMDDVDKQNGDSRNLRGLFVTCRLLLPAGHACVKCAEDNRQGHLSLHNKPRHIDNLVFRCTVCHDEQSHKYGSLLEPFHIALLQLARLLLFFDDQLTVTQAHGLSSVSDDTITKLYRFIRERMEGYMLAYPIIFGPFEIIEIDEIYLKPLRSNGEVDERKSEWMPIIGCISRNTKCVTLHICKSHKVCDIRESIMSHFVSDDTTVITDRHKSFGFLDRVLGHKWCTKRHIGANVYPVVVSGQTKFSVPFQIHTNTIEGFWSNFRLK
jgi:hypothetical protein